jgi:thioredoxin 1
METFNDLIKGDRPVLVDFFAEWCGPCKMMPSILSEVKNAVGNAATIVKVDIDKNPETAAKYNVRGVPTLIIFQRGQVKWRQSGVVAAQELKQVLSRFTTALGAPR